MSEMSIEALLNKIGYTANNKDLFLQAMTHKSYLKDNPDFVGNNEILEFLGDAVLDLLVGEWLMIKFSEDDEGRLTRKRASLVNEESLFRLGKKMNFSDYIRVGDGAADDLKENPRIISSMFEAVVGAIYRDTTFTDCRELFFALFNKYWSEVSFVHDFEGDYKTRFQELAQEKFKLTPVYKVVSESGPDHEKEFVVRVFVGKRCFGEGKGASKKTAAQKSAETALEKA